MAFIRQIQRKDTQANWESSNPILGAGEFGSELDTNRFKMGDGVTAWLDLSYFENTAAIGGSLENYILLTEKGSAQGVATLDENGNIPTSQLGNIIDGAPNILDTLKELADAVGNDGSFINTINATIDSAKIDAVSEANSYTNSVFTGLVNGAPAALDTLKELSDALGADANFSTTILNHIDSIQVADQSYTDTAVSNAYNNINSRTDSLIATEVNDRNNAIAIAKTQAISDSEAYTDTKVAQEATARQDSITSNVANAKGEAIYESEQYTDSQILSLSNTLVNQYTAADQSTLELAHGYTNEQITTEILNRDAAIDIAKTQAETFATTADEALYVTVTDDIATSLTNAEFYTDSSISTEVANRNSAIATAKSEAITTSETYTDNSSSNVVVQMESYTDTKISTEVSDRNSAISTAKSEAIATSEGYTDTSIATEVTNRNSAISSAISTEVTNRNSAISTALSTAEGYTDTAITTEITNRNSAIATAKSQAISTSEGYTDTVIATEITNRNSAISTSLSTAEGYTDTAISNEVTNRNSAIATAKTQAINTSESYTDSAIATEVTNRNSAISAITTTGVSEGTNLYFTNERAQDAVASALTAGSGISVSYDDPNNIITIANTGVTSVVGTSNQISVATSNGTRTLSLPNTLIAPGSLEVTGDTKIDGNLTVAGTTFTVDSQTLQVQDNMIYMNAPIEATITNASGNGTTITYTANNAFVVGDVATITGITPSGFNISGTITQANNNQFKVDNVFTGTYVSGGLARARVAANPDIGFAAGYNDGTYHHTGLFRDASDGIYKFFQNYNPEPDAAVYIDITDASFQLAPIQASIITASDHFIGNITGNVTGNVSGNAGTVTNGIYTTSTGVVTSTMILDGTIVDADINASANIAATKIAGTAITAADTGTVTSTMILDGTIVNGDISATAGIAATKIAGTAVTQADSGTVTSTMIADGTIVNGDISSSAAIAVSKLAASTISGVTLGSNLNALTIGTGLTGTSYNGSGAVTVTIDSTVATLTGTQTLTNKTLTSPIISSISNTGTLTLPTSTDTLVGRATTDTLTNKSISGSTNTLTNIPNSALTNSSITVNGSAVSLGGSVTINALPTQTGNSGKYLTTDGTNASWVTLVTSYALSNLTDATITSATTNDVLTYNGTKWVNQNQNAIPLLSNAPTITSNAYTIGLTDFTSGKMLELNNGSTAMTLNIPTNASVAFPIGTQITLLQTGAGQVTVSATTPATTTVNGAPGTKLRGQWSSATLIKRATDVWVLIGDLSA